jgi:putative transposase
MSFYSPASPCQTFQAALAPFLTDDGLPFANVLTAQQIEQACHDEGVCFGDTSRSVYNPAVTLWAFLSQVVDSDKSCRAAALRVLNLSIEQQQGPCSIDTGMYCRARAKLPASLSRRLTYQTTDQLEEAIPAHWLWKGRHVYLADGTTSTLPDTAANQAAYPQPPTQKVGLGFPMIRMVVLLSLATAAVSGMAFGRYEGKETGETALLRQLLDRLRPGSVLLADRFYCSYFMVALLKDHGVDVVMRQHQRRDTDFRLGERLGVDDHIVVWTRPERPEWMDEETYAQMPATLTIREVRKQVDTLGCRVDELVAITTLLDPLVYTREDVLDAFHSRWHVELDLRSIKATLDMETLRCKTPAMVEKELWTTLLGYTLVRKVSSQAALLAGKHPRQISFKASLQTVRESWGSLTSGRRACRGLLVESLLAALGQEQVGDRPDRCEPRAVKRRPKKQKLLTVPRQEARARLLRGGGR